MVLQNCLDLAVMFVIGLNDFSCTVHQMIQTGFALKYEIERKYLKEAALIFFKPFILVPQKACLFELSYIFLWMLWIIYFYCRASQWKVVTMNVTISPKLFHWLSTCSLLAQTTVLRFSQWLLHPENFCNSNLYFFSGIVWIHQEKRHSTASSISFIENC